MDTAPGQTRASVTITSEVPRVSGYDYAGQEVELVMDY
jgi:hypothetical protein